MFMLIGKKQIFMIALCFLVLCGCAVFGVCRTMAEEKEQEEYIKWVNFNIPYEVLEKAMKLDIDSHATDAPVDWVQLLAYSAAKNGDKKFSVAEIDKIAKQLKEGSTIEQMTKNLKSYAYYHEAYEAVLGEFLSEYEIEVKDDTQESGKRWEKTYGLKAFSPIAKGYPYQDYDDFGNSRSYGYQRKHLGHDFMGAVGTPVIAVEGGTIENMGWNQYGGWRIGIRSFDGKRYYYYAHLRQNFPYHKSLEEGMQVQAGDVIGYLGRTGYSAKENANNIDQSHLHFGMQLIFDESQREGIHEIWIDVYDIAKLLRKNQSEVVKNPETKDYHRVYEIK
jgi:murein DD-endopeptidase MepM/ murein hydrolase activator NlpD